MDNTFLVIDLKHTQFDSSVILDLTKLQGREVFLELDLPNILEKAKKYVAEGQYLKAYEAMKGIGAYLEVYKQYTYYNSYWVLKEISYIFIKGEEYMSKEGSKENNIELCRLYNYTTNFINTMELSAYNEGYDELMNSFIHKLRIKLEDLHCLELLENLDEMEHCSSNNIYVESNKVININNNKFGKNILPIQ